MDLVTKPFGEQRPKGNTCPYCGGRKEVTIIKSTGQVETLKCGYCNHEGKVVVYK